MWRITLCTIITVWISDKYTDEVTEQPIVPLASFGIKSLDIVPQLTPLFLPTYIRAIAEVLADIVRHNPTLVHTLDEISISWISEIQAHGS